MNFASTVDLHARGRPDATAVIARGDTWTYDDLAALTNRFANLLADRDVEVGDRVGFYTPNVPEYVVGYLGALKHGSLPVPINKRLDSGAIGHVLKHVSPETVVTTTELVGRLPTEAREPIVLDSDGEDFPALTELLEPYEPAFDAVPRQNDDAASIMYTSGSTGRPKGVIHQHGYNFANAASRVDFLDLGSADVAHVVSPIFHISGETVMLMAVYAGCPLVLQRDWDPHEFLARVEGHDVTFMHLISTVLVELTELAPTVLDDYNTSSLRAVLTGGGALTTDQIRFFERHIGGTVSEGYGRTEGGTAFNPLEGRQLGSNGVPLRNANEIRVADPDTGETLPSGEQGEIRVRGDGVSVGYYKRDELTDQLTDEEGWMRTEDLGWFDDKGFLHFDGRMDDMIKTGGENVYPQEIERVLLDMDEVSEAVVVGLSDEKWGERVAAAIVAGDPALSVDDVMTHCRASLAGFKLPREIAFLNELPQQGSKKFDRAAVAAHFDEE